CVRDEWPGFAAGAWLSGARLYTREIRHEAAQMDHAYPACRKAIRRLLGIPRLVRPLRTLGPRAVYGHQRRRQDLRNKFRAHRYALGNLEGIKAVEISLDGGSTWRPTTIFSRPSPIVWTFWKFIWNNPRPGAYHI